MDAGVIEFEWIGRPRSAAEQGFEKVGRLLRRVDAFGVVARDKVGVAAAARARLQVGEVGLHAHDLPLDLAALGGRFGAEEQKLLIVAADRMGVGARARELGALAIRRRLELSAAMRRRCDRRLQTGAVGGLGERIAGRENTGNSRSGRHQSTLRQKSAPAEAARHANHRRLHIRRVAPKLRRRAF